ncbi:hypothetical protein J4436_01310 [Candidatus Woesearchaeota archaeon]|nr:hypothetical protein [Candidatus Woesearchaeota archaeon]
MKITIILIFLLSIIPVTASLEETMKDAINKNQIQIPEYAKRILPVTGRIITTDTGERIYLKLDINDLTIIEPVEEYDIELKTTLKLIQETMPLNSQEEIKLKIQQNYENIELKSKTWKGEIFISAAEEITGLELSKDKTIKGKLIQRAVALGNIIRSWFGYQYF